MIKSDLTREMKKFTGCPFITRKQLADFLGYKDRHSVGKYLNIPKISGKYWINDVVNEIFEKG